MIGGFTPDKSRNNFLHAQTMASAILFESRTSVTGSAFRGFILVLQKNAMLQDTHLSRSNMGAFQCIHRRNPSSPSWLNEVKVDLNGHRALIG